MSSKKVLFAALFSLLGCLVSTNALADPVFPFPAAYTRVVACNNCANDNSWGGVAENQFARNQGGVVYLIDFTNNAYKKEYVTVRWIDTGDRTIGVHDATEITNLNSQEIDMFNKLFQLAASMKSYTASSPTIE